MRYVKESTFLSIYQSPSKQNVKIYVACVKHRTYFSLFHQKPIDSETREPEVQSANSFLGVGPHSCGTLLLHKLSSGILINDLSSDIHWRFLLLLSPLSKSAIPALLHSIFRSHGGVQVHVTFPLLLQCVGVKREGSLQPSYKGHKV